MYPYVDRPVLYPNMDQKGHPLIHGAYDSPYNTLFFAEFDWHI